MLSAALFMVFVVLDAIVTAVSEKLWDGFKTVKAFCYLGDRLNASGDSEAAATAGARIEWVKF